ncbi:hypothetical protein FPT84_09195 [Salmonella enterica]|uniref:Uncharacterized protein n=2 Tax=Salmonella enterica I TaxID=59201 RepID=A0A5U3G1Z1_SALET|nr:hypothetical protein [Salmonella enterica]EBH9883017.1 hypothetical protein [Salmonella enterica subsp. enterica serovar Kisarawe]EBP4059868.1 hypothetical protein [Salmonella enterica subsp. enterica]AXD42543.1 hypothetical protein CHD70_09615 [Salmonella enterica]EAA7567754.1 hypothetical protein [Salmonella enterica]EAS5875317.1 hypothetical protein [Salmonella enterica]
MAKTQMQLANRAWRTETKALGWHHGWKTGRKGWKAFCRENAAITVEEHLKTDPPFTDQADANWHVAEELTYWTN